MPLTSLLALLVGCRCPDVQTSREVVVFVPTWADLEAALDEDGQLTVDGCERLCASAAVDLGVGVQRVDECGFTDPAASPVSVPEWLVAAGATGGTGGTGGTGATDATTGDTGGPPPPMLSCVAMTFSQCIGGRHHLSVASRGPCSAEEPVGAWLAVSALAEATSVKAFVSLALELERLGAPGDLVARSRAAALDEVVHARILGAEARARGAVVGAATFRPTPARDLLAFAVENAVEGCVVETWAALVAGYQAVHAEDDRLARAYARIAADEARHAELAWAIDRWVTARLSPAERAVVEAARARAVAALFIEVTEPAAELQRVAGMPGVPAARRLLRGLASGLWEPTARAA